MILFKHSLFRKNLVHVIFLLTPKEQKGLFLLGLLLVLLQHFVNHFPVVQFLLLELLALYIRQHYYNVESLRNPFVGRHLRRVKIFAEKYYFIVLNHRRIQLHSHYDIIRHHAVVLDHHSEIPTKCVYPLDLDHMRL